MFKLSLMYTCMNACLVDDDQINRNYLVNSTGRSFDDRHQKYSSGGVEQDHPARMCTLILLYTLRKINDCVWQDKSCYDQIFK